MANDTATVDELLPTYATEHGVCRSDGCASSAPMLVVGKKRTQIQMLCEACQTRHEQQDAHRAARLLLERAGIPKRLAPWTLDTYPTDDRSRHALGQAQQWLDDCLAARALPADEPAAQAKRRNLLLFGGIGTGKSSLAAALAQCLCEHGIPARWTVFRDLLELKRESYDGGEPVNIDALRRAPVLVLDDLGAERLTPWAAEQLEVIVSTRYDACAPTIVTSNLTAGQLAAAIASNSTGDTDLIRARRIASRLTENAHRIDLNGPDRRLALARTRERAHANPYPLESAA